MLKRTLPALIAFALAGPAATADLRSSDAFIRMQLHHPGALGYVAAAADLNGDGRAAERFILVQDQAFCGSGGCVLLAIAPRGRGWTILMRATISRAPVYLLRSRSRGWRDLAVTVGGGGLSSHLAVMRFDGRRYPSNPSTQPALTDRRRIGALIIPESGRPG